MLTSTRTLLLSSLSLGSAALFCSGPAFAQTIHAPARLALLESPALASSAPYSLDLRADLPASSSVADADALPADALPADTFPDSPMAPQDQQPKGPQTSPGSPLGRASTLAPSRQPTSTDITVPPHVVAPRQSAGDKLLGSVYDSISPFSLVGELISASYSQLTDGSPNYDIGGSTGTQFGKRLGAAVARGTSQNLFSEGVLAAALHEDPRYYQMGSGNNFFKRLFYAGTRPIITRTDSGASTPNLALLGGYLGAAELTPVYYPPLNQSQTEVMKTWGSSIGGAALGYVVTEFLPDVLHGLHLQKFSHY